MKTISKSVTVEFTLEEIELITTALHGEYKYLKNFPCESQEQSKHIYNKILLIKDLRNTFAEHIGRYYAEEDA